MKRYPLFLAIIVLCMGCTDETPPPPGSNTVHMAGFIVTSDLAPVASYWENGAYTKLVSDSAYSTVRSLVVDGSTTLIGGNNFSPPAPGEVFIWQNGTKSIVSDAFGDGPLLASNDNNLFAVWFSESAKGWAMSKNSALQPLIDTADSWPTAVALLNNDLYISGAALGQEYTRDPVVDYSDQYAQCWKNDALVFRESDRSFAWSIYAYQNDIYLGGWLQFTNANRVACYWKNGTRVELANGEEDTGVYSMFVVDGHVYAAGTSGNHACYWKDGAITMLPHEGTVRSGGNSICVSGDDVHIVGYDDGYPAYWKNGVKETFQHQEKRGELKVVVVNQ